MTQTAIGTRQVIVLNPVRYSRIIWAAASAGITPQKYITIKIKTEEFGEVTTNVWEIHQTALFNKILKHVDGLQWYDFPRIINIPLYGVIVQIDIPTYNIIPNK